ncbi:MAG TPA: ATP-dependent Clp protease adaptor ClpS [Phycisphaerae bacterium]|nr:ATP-dependent Clp protease adaptor ClpS [Phycisphaerae bacterium]
MAKNAKKQVGPENTQHSTAAAPTSVRPRHLPAFKVILHNDDVNGMEHVVESLVMLTPLNRVEAARVTDEADKTGSSLVLVIHKERAELYVEQLQSRQLTVSIEPAE